MADQHAMTGRGLGVAGRVAVTLAATLLLTIAVTAVGGAISEQVAADSPQREVPAPTTTSPDAQNDGDFLVAKVRDCAKGGQLSIAGIVPESDDKLSIRTDRTDVRSCSFVFCVPEGGLQGWKAVSDGTKTLSSNADESALIFRLGGEPKTVPGSSLTLCSGSGSTPAGTEIPWAADQVSKKVSGCGGRSGKVSVELDNSGLVAIVEVSISGNAACNFKFCVPVSAVPNGLADREGKVQVLDSHANTFELSVEGGVQPTTIVNGPKADLSWCPEAQ